MAPIAALRDVALDRTGTSVRRAVIGTVVTVLGAAFLAMGLSGGASRPRSALGALRVFVGVAVLGPVIARPFARVIGAPLPRFRGMAGTLARRERDPQPAPHRGNGVGADDRRRPGGVHHRVRRIDQGVDRRSRSTTRCAATGSSRRRGAWADSARTPPKALDALPETAKRHVRCGTRRLTVDGIGVDVAAFDPSAIGRRRRPARSEGDLHDARRERPGGVAGRPAKENGLDARRQGAR